MKNSNDTIVNRTRDLPVCDAGPEPTAPLRAPYIQGNSTKIGRNFSRNIGTCAPDNPASHPKTQSAFNTCRFVVEKSCI
jgi:hypothetical protein